MMDGVSAYGQSGFLSVTSSVALNKTGLKVQLWDEISDRLTVDARIG